MELGYVELGRQLSEKHFIIFYIVHVTSYSFTAVFAGVFGTIQTSAIDCICERS